MKAKEYQVLKSAIENGVTYGWNRAHKYTDTPSSEDIKEAIEQAVLSEICEWFNFDDDDDLHERLREHLIPNLTT